MRRKMNKLEFHKLANTEINHLLQKIEEQNNPDIVEADILDEILTIELLGNRQYVINKQSYAQQIWLSSPISGAHHFSYDLQKKEWITKKGLRLGKLLSEELGFAL